MALADSQNLIYNVRDIVVFTRSDILYMFFCSRNAQVTFVEKSQLQITSFEIKILIYISYFAVKAFKVPLLTGKYFQCTVVNLTCFYKWRVT